MAEDYAKVKSFELLQRADTRADYVIDVRSVYDQISLNYGVGSI